MDAKSLTFSFASSGTPEADAAAQRLTQRYGQMPAAEADIVVALGGDGFLLQTLRDTMGTGKNVFGMNRGTVGFLMNEYQRGRRARAHRRRGRRDHPPARNVTVDDRRRDGDGARHQRGLAAAPILPDGARLRIIVDGKVRLDELICDGVMVATPAGSTAYNLSAHGPILPLDAPLLALTPVSPFRPRRWRGALLPNRAVVRFDILEAAEAAGERRRRPHRGQVGGLRRQSEVGRRYRHPAVRPQPFLERTHPDRAVQILSHRSGLSSD